MNYTDFTRHVQSLAQLDSIGEAEAATMATLEIFAQCVPTEVMRLLAPQLPRDLKGFCIGKP